MDPNPQEKQNPNKDLFSSTKISQEFFQYLNITDSCEFDEDEEQEEEFSFMSGGVANTPPIAAEDAFMNGQIKPVYPLLNRDVLFSVGDLPIKPPVDRVFVEMPERGSDKVTSSTPENDEIAGPYCDWSNGKAVEVVAPPSEACKKSNSTGFSKIWRFKDFMGRSNSGGRDAFVFLNHGHPTPSSSEKPAAVMVKGSKEEKVERKEATVRKVKRGSKDSRTASLSAHEVYLKSKAKGVERRRSYLPYRPALMGFFTNVNGGLTKNVHPY